MTYSITEISRSLKISRSTLYYKPRPTEDDPLLLEAVKVAFDKGRQTYGTRRIRAELRNNGIVASRRKISAIMKNKGLVSVYTKKKYKRIASKVNEEPIHNIVARNFDGHRPNEVIVTDLTYITIGHQWHYVCPLLDLCGRKLISYSVGIKKTSDLVLKALRSVKVDLRKIKILHTDRGSEFKNILVDNFLSAFSISRSLSDKGNPIDNAVIESFNKTLKYDFANRDKFENIDDFIRQMDDYMDWYNNVRLHSSLNYMTPTEWTNNAS